MIFKPSRFRMLNRDTLRLGAVQIAIAVSVRKTSLLRRAAAVGLLVAMSAAYATTIAATKVSVKLEGEIAPECTIGATDAVGVNMGQADVMRPGTKDFGFTVNCNTPFEYRLEARYGALTHTGGLAAAVPYTVGMYIPTDGTTINDRCAGENIRSGQVRCPFSNSGNGIAMGSRGRMTLAWAPGKSVPSEGSYSDDIAIYVGERL